MLVYGPSGAGKKTRVMAALKQIYGPGVEKVSLLSHALAQDGCAFVHHALQQETRNQFGFFKLPLGIDTQVNAYSFIGSDVGMYDRVVIQDLIKEVAQTQQIDASAKRSFKGIFQQDSIHSGCF